MKTNRSFVWILGCVLVLGVAACGGDQDAPDEVGNTDHALAQDTSDALGVVAEVAGQIAGAVQASATPTGELRPTAEVTPAGSGPQAEAKPAGSDPMSGGANSTGRAIPVPGGEAADPQDPCYVLSRDSTHPLKLTVEFNACPLPNGEELNGRASAWIAQGPPNVQVGVSFAALSVGPRAITGEILFSASATAIIGQATIDLSNSDNGQRLVLTSATLEITKNAVTIDGVGSFTDQNKTTYSIDLQSLRWDDLRNCYPTSGTIVLDSPPSPPTSLTYVKTTEGPAVDVQVGNLPPYRIQLHCPFAT
jgi:hypothetical protein